MDPREELEALRRMAELEAKASGQAYTPAATIPQAEMAGQIPGQRSISKAEAPLTTAEKIRGVIETPFAVGANLVSGPITYLAGALGPEAQQAVARNIQYQPRTRMAQQALEGIASAGEASKLPPFMPTLGVTNALSTATRPAVNVLAEEGRLIKGAVAAPFEQRAARTLQENVAQSVKNAPQIEAAQKAAELGIVLNPAASNPTKMNKIKGVVIGNKAIDTKAAALNDARWGELAKEEMGLAADTVLDKKAFETARDNISGPYRVIEQMPALAPTQEIGAALNKLRQSEELIGGAKVKAAIDGLVDDAMSKIGQGMPGDQVIKNIRQMRNEAQDIYKAKKTGAALSPEEVALADTKMGVANALESLIEANIQDPKALDDFRKARIGMAKTYAYEAATDLNTGKVDPMAIAKMTAGDNSLTGTIADIGKIAGNFPEVAKAGTQADRYLPTLSRSGIGGSAGYAVGSLFGAPLTGSIVGAGLGGLMSAGGAKGITGRAYQLANAIPTDYRPPVNMLRPAPINYGPNQLVPYDYAQAALTPEEMPYRPNWTPGRPTPDVTVSPPPAGAPQLQAPSAERTMAGLRAEQQRRYGMERTLDEQAAARAEAEAAAARTPTRGGSVIDIDPVTGKMVLGAEGTAGMTPNIQVIESTGSALASAARKIAGAPVETTETKFASYKNKQGTPIVRQTSQTTSVERGAAGSRAFDLTAEERIAWNKTRADLAEVATGLEKLDDKAVAAKMMDRKWAQDALTKAREKAQMFEDLARRMEGEQAKRDAAIKRDQMLDLADLLEENMRAPRPVSSGGQGPKTREFRRNQLAQDRELKNMLLKD